QEATTEVLHREIFATKPMDTIHAEEHPVTLAPASIELGQRAGHLADRELQPGAGMDPGDCHNPRTWTHRLHERLDNLFPRHGLQLLVQRDLSNRSAGPLTHQT